MVKDHNASPPPANATATNPESGEESLESLEHVPMPGSEEPLRTQCSVSDASALTRKTDTKADVKKKEKDQQAEIEQLQTELQKVKEEKQGLEIKKDFEILVMEEKCVKIITSRAGDLKRKDDEIKCLQEEIEELKSAKDVQEALSTREKLQAVSQQERDAQHELASTQRELASANDTLQNLQQEMTRLQGQHQRDLTIKQQELERERDRQNQQLTETEVCQEWDNVRGELKEVRDLEEERDQLVEQLRMQAVSIDYCTRFPPLLISLLLSSNFSFLALPPFKKCTVPKSCKGTGQKGGGPNPLLPPPSAP